LAPEADPGRGHDAVELRDVVEADLPALFEHQLDPEANRMAAFPPRDERAFMAHWARILADPSLMAKAVLVGGRVAGNVVSFEREGRRMVGYWLGREFWGRGVATRALALFLQQVPDRPLEARVAKHNAASLRVLRKCGFTITGEDVIPVEEEIGEEIEEFVLTLER
jgi:RimJ/RimL family protein N-acetyltransferase